VSGVKYPGVVDFFRIPKLGAAFYQAQVDPTVRTVIAPAFYWDFGPNSPSTGPGRDAVIWSNCDRLAVYVGQRRVAVARPQRGLFPHLPHPPFFVDLTVHPDTAADLRIDGYVGTKFVARRLFCADPTLDTLSIVPDDTTIDADGQDATRLVVRALDRYGAARPFGTGSVLFGVTGPGVLVGDNPFDFEAAGGAGAVWLRSVRGLTGRVTVTASHTTLGTEETTIRVG
jgi:beta-galactosidase